MRWGDEDCGRSIYICRDTFEEMQGTSYSSGASRRVCGYITNRPGGWERRLPGFPVLSKSVILISAGS